MVGHVEHGRGGRVVHVHVACGAVGNLGVGQRYVAAALVHVNGSCVVVGVACVGHQAVVEFGSRAGLAVELESTPVACRRAGCRRCKGDGLVGCSLCNELAVCSVAHLKVALGQELNGGSRGNG